MESFLLHYNGDLYFVFKFFLLADTVSNFKWWGVLFKLNCFFVSFAVQKTFYCFLHFLDLRLPFMARQGSHAGLENDLVRPHSTFSIAHSVFCIYMYLLNLLTRCIVYKTKDNVFHSKTQFLSKISMITNCVLTYMYTTSNVMCKSL